MSDAGTITRGGAEAEASPTAWWAAFGVWRGDVRLFARVATAIIEELSGRGFSAECEIQFQVRGDVESFSSPQELVELVTPQALRAFHDAHIRIQGGPVRVDVQVRKRKHGLVIRRGHEAPLAPGVSLLVTLDEGQPEEIAQDIRDAIARVIERGSRSWLTNPETGRSPEQNLDRGLRRSSGWRASLINNVLFFVTLVVAFAAARRLHSSELFPLLFAGALRALAGFATAQGTAFTDPFLPTVEISDTSTAVRVLRSISGFLVVGVGAGVLSAYLAHLLGL